MKRVVPIIIVPALVTMVVACFVAWARSVDPYIRKEFSIAGADCHGTVVLPKRTNDDSRYAVVVFVRQPKDAHSREPDMRQFADVGLAGATCEIDAKSKSDFEQQLVALENSLASQSWAKHDAMVWIESSRGSERTVLRMLQPRQSDPLLVVNLAAPTAEAENVDSSTSRVEAERNNYERSPELSNPRRGDAQVQVNHVNDLDHVAGNDDRVVIRCIAEFCKSRLTPDRPYPELPQARPIPVWICFILPMACAAYGLSGGLRPRIRGISKLLQTATARLCLLVCAMCGLLLAFVYLIVPTLRVTPRSLAVCRTFLVSRSMAGDYDRLARLPVWKGQRVASVLEHVDLANYTVTRLLNWKLDTSIYGDFVLSPIIEEPRLTAAAEGELSWRKDLWKSFWPRVRHENSPEAAAKIVVRNLRERVTIARDFRKQAGVRSTWMTKIANMDDFEALYVAALRSVGIPARLTSEHHAEFWDNKSWRAAPQPPIVTWAN